MCYLSECIIRKGKLYQFKHEPRGRVTENYKKEGLNIMTNDECFQAALKMIQVTPETYESLNPSMILKLSEIISEADRKFHEPSENDDPKKEILSF